MYCVHDAHYVLFITLLLYVLVSVYIVEHCLWLCLLGFVSKSTSVSTCFIPLAHKFNTVMFVCTNVDFYAPKVLSFSSSLLCNNTCTCIYYACCICVMLLVVAVHNDTSIRLIQCTQFCGKVS